MLRFSDAAGQQFANELYLQWCHKTKNGRCNGGTLMFSSTSAYGEKILIGCNSAEKEY